jgi:hypothetical protein
MSTNPIIGKPLNREATSAAADRLRGKIARWLVRASDANLKGAVRRPSPWFGSLEWRFVRFAGLCYLV